MLKLNDFFSRLQFNVDMLDKKRYNDLSKMNHFNNRTGTFPDAMRLI